MLLPSANHTHLVFEPACLIGMESPEELVLHHAGRISAQRDRTTLQGALVHAVYAILGSSSAGLYRLYSLEGDRLAGLVAQADADGVCALDDSLSWPVNTASIEHFPALHRCFSANASVATQAGPDADHEHVFPIVLAPETFFGFVVVRQATALTQRQRSILHGLLGQFCNQLRMLDDSEIDVLTGLLNRRTFDESLRRTLSSLQQNDAGDRSNVLHLPRRRINRVGEQSHWLGVIDIDHFKLINDNYGHQIGDEALRLIAGFMKTAFRAHDKLFRFGGEEFIVVLKPATAENAAAIFERFRRQVEAHEFPKVGRITISGGFTRIGVQDESSTIIDNADDALYWAKHHGRNRVCSYEALLDAGELRLRGHAQR